MAILRGCATRDYNGSTFTCVTANSNRRREIWILVRVIFIALVNSGLDRGVQKRRINMSGARRERREMAREKNVSGLMFAASLCEWMSLIVGELDRFRKALYCSIISGSASPVRTIYLRIRIVAISAFLSRSLLFPRGSLSLSFRDQERVQRVRAFYTREGMPGLVGTWGRRLRWVDFVHTA